MPTCNIKSILRHFIEGHVTCLDQSLCQLVASRPFWDISSRDAWRVLTNVTPTCSSVHVWVSLPLYTWRVLTGRRASLWYHISFTCYARKLCEKYLAFLALRQGNDTESSWPGRSKPGQSKFVKPQVWVWFTDHDTSDTAFTLCF